MTLQSIYAFLAFLSAFNIPQPTIDQIHDILIPSAPIASSTPISNITPPIIQITVQQSPSFGSTPTVPVVQSPVMDTTPPQFELITVDRLDARTADPQIGGDITAPAGWYLRLGTDKQIDASAFTLPQGITLGQVTYAGDTANPNSRAFFRVNGARVEKPVYYFEAQLLGVDTQTSLPITIKDTAGNAVTRSIVVTQ